MIFSNKKKNHICDKSLQIEGMHQLHQFKQGSQQACICRWVEIVVQVDLEGGQSTSWQVT